MWPRRPLSSYVDQCFSVIVSVDVRRSHVEKSLGPLFVAAPTHSIRVDCVKLPSNECRKSVKLSQQKTTELF